jgi:hypothetical protein
MIYGPAAAERRESDPVQVHPPPTFSDLAGRERQQPRAIVATVVATSPGSHQRHRARRRRRCSGRTSRCAGAVIVGPDDAGPHFECMEPRGASRAAYSLLAIDTPALVMQ